MAMIFAISAAKAQADEKEVDEKGNCQCVAYVKKRYTIVGGVGANGGAKDYGPILTNSTNGFQVVAEPQNKDIAVMQPCFPGSHKVYGHIALVGKVTKNSNGTITVVLYGANQGGNMYSECGCSNVSSWKITVNNSNKNCIKFYRNLSKYHSCD